MNVQPITNYLCTRCDVQGSLKHTKTCWSCGQTDSITYASPYVSHSFAGMTLPQEVLCASPSLESFSATFAARFAGAWRGRSAPSPSAAPES